ncbi:MAG TPA: polyprenyl diphosphate synthase, partial [Methylophilaceae bacterium]|nr:polyprenyl diphosphate synthase [Methylophilaceae bacterium]
MALFSSSTQTVPPTSAVPRHIAVIMDGNGRWAKKRFLPRIAGHKRGVEVVRDMVKECATLGVEYLTLFAFSSENWRRPQEEVSFLMGLFMEALKHEVSKLHQNNIRLVMIGDRSRFDDALRAQIDEAERTTAGNSGLVLTIAANYGGRWDLMQA